MKFVSSACRIGVTKLKRLAKHFEPVLFKFMCESFLFSRIDNVFLARQFCRHQPQRLNNLQRLRGAELFESARSEHELLRIVLQSSSKDVRLERR